MVMTAFIDKIISETGPRPAGSESEFRAGEIIAHEFMEHGAEASYHDTVTAPEFIHGMINLMTVMYGLSVILYLFVPLAAACLVAVMLTTLLLSRIVGNRAVLWLFRKVPTRSVMGTFRPTGGVKNVLIFSGHHDSPYMMPLFYSPLKRFVFLVENAGALGALLLIPAGVIRQFGSGGTIAGSGFGPVDWLFAASLAGFAVTLYYRFMMISKERNLGANDNLSAIAVLAGLAEHLKNNRPRHTEVRLVSFGAEEPHVGGSEAFARDNAELVRRAVNVNLETVGAGELAVISREKMINLDYTPEVVDLISRAGSRAGLHVPAVKISYGGTDSASLIRQGGKSACLFGMDKTGLFSLWHSPEDRPENISEDNLRKALKVCLEVIALTEEERE